MTLMVAHIFDFSQLRHVESMAPVQASVRHAVVVRYAVGVHEMIGLDVVAALAGPASGAQTKI